MDILKPTTTEHVLDAVKWAVSSTTPLNVQGLNSKAAMGQATNIGHSLDLSGLTGIDLYDPDELVLEGKAGTSLADIQEALAKANQMLAFEPPDLSALLAGSEWNADAPMAGSLGGLVACNLAGPRRIKAGAARDHLLGFEAVSGRGENFKSGGRVMKNVTGFDLSKLMAGSFGTLGVMTTITMKVLPSPDKVRTVIIIGLDTAAAVKAMSVAMNSPHEVTAAAHYTVDQTATSGVDRVEGLGRSATFIRVEGPAPSVEARAAGLTDMLKSLGPIDELHTERSTRLWREVRDVVPFTGAAHKADQVWRLSVPPAEGASVAARLKSSVGGESLLDWGGGLIWHRMVARDDAGHADVRSALGRSGGHAMLMKASSQARAAVPVFHPEDPGLVAISRRIKDGFDPEGILNPGRMMRVEQV